MPSIIQADQLKSADGVTTYLNSGTLSNVTLPSGSIVNVWSTQASSAIVISNTGNQATNTDSLTNVTLTRRVYAKIANVTVNIASGNDLIINGWWGHLSSGGTSSNVGGWGCVFKVPDSSGNNRGYEGSVYPYYPTASFSSTYGNDWSGQLLVGEYSGDTIATGDIEVAMYAYAYNETSPSATQTIGVGKRYLTVMEVQR
tara:strand:- start:1428 stop:2027 length:600 start_codon:yes stop_codon:yes gene_type:complete